jgi:putative phosphoesterase
MSRLGVISDTHGWLRPEAIEALRGCDYVAHAGDIGDPDVITQLDRLAFVYAVKGNSDRGSWCAGLKKHLSFRVGGLACLLTHDLDHLAEDPICVGVGLVISGHTHTARIEHRGAVLYVNPGSAGPRRPGHQVTVCLIDIDEGQATARIVLLPSD